MPENIQPYLEEVTKALQARGWSETSVIQNEDGDIVYKGDPAGNFYNDFSAMEGNEPFQEWIGEFESYVEDNMERIERAIDKNLFDWEVFPDSWKTPERVLGFTDDVMLAGYILPDGSMLDFSGGSGERVIDHREIVHLREGSPGTAGMQEYMAEGNIRIDANTGFIDISRLPTDAQRKRILEMIKRSQGILRLGLSYGLGERSDRGDYYLEPDRHRVIDFDVAYPSDIFRAIDEFFEGPKKMPGRRTRKKKASKEKDLGYGSFQDDLVDFRTGEPVDFPYVRMVQDTPFMGETFQQHIDPAGRYMSYNETGEETPIETDRIKATYGKASFSNPLVLWFNTGEEFGYNEHSWKARLHDHYGKTGKALSRAITKDGHDGIITIRRDTDPPTVSEIVDLRPIIRKTKAWLSRICKFAQPQQMVLPFHDPGEYATEPVEVKPDIGDYHEGAEEDEWATGFYHVTTNLPAVLSSGELKSRSQLEEPIGLGGGGDDVAPNKVSVTHNYDQAFKLRDMMRFAAEVVHGKVNPSSALWEIMQNYGVDDLSLMDNLLRFLAGEGVPKDVIEDEGVDEWLDANIKLGKDSYKFMQGVDEAMLRETSSWDVDPGQFTGFTMPFESFSKIKPENIGIVQVMVHKTAKPEHVPEELELRFDPKDVMLMQEESAVIGSRAWVLKNCMAAQETFDWYSPQQHFETMTGEEIEDEIEDEDEERSIWNDDEQLVFHGTTRSNFKNILVEGLVPQVGKFTGRFYGGDEEMEPEELLYFATKDEVQKAFNAIVFQIGMEKSIEWPYDSVTLSDVSSDGILLAVNQTQGMYEQDEHGESKELGSEYLTEETPVGVETGDVWTRENQSPVKIMTGAPLIRAMLDYAPDLYKRLKTNDLR